MKHSPMITGTMLIVLLFTSCNEESSWKDRTDQQVNVFGHRNWIVIADAAYPRQSAAGIETIQTGADHLEVLEYVLSAVENAEHVKPIIMLDKELEFVPEEEAQGIEEFRSGLAHSLGEFSPASKPHEEIIHSLDEASRYYNILILKTRMMLPYTSIFIELDCGYWSGGAEEALRARMDEN